MGKIAMAKKEGSKTVEKALSGSPDLRPNHQFGYICPVLVSDFIHYQFYRIFPEGSFLVAYHLDLKTFTPQGVDEAFKSFWKAFDFLVSRKVESITLGGVPLSAFAGRPRILELLAEARMKTDIPVTTDFEDVIAALKHLKLQRIAVAAKWEPPLMQAVLDYLKHAGIEPIASFADPHTASEVIQLGPDDSVAMALKLGREALAKSPKADGLFLAGGAWLIQQAVPVLEAEFDRPVVTNPGAINWAILHRSRMRSPLMGLGRLLDGLK
jgi:arylmalonate decarboxylase